MCDITKQWKDQEIVLVTYTNIKKLLLKHWYFKNIYDILGKAKYTILIYEEEILTKRVDATALLMMYSKIQERVSLFLLGRFNLA